MEYFTELGYLGLFISAFVAATILPLSSEIVLSALLLAELDPMFLVVVATLGNVLGSTVNYAIGFWGSALLLKKVLKVPEIKLESAKSRFQRYGVWSLLFAWVPVIGDPLTIIAGLLKVNIITFLMLVSIGKLGHYLVVTYTVLP